MARIRTIKPEFPQSEAIGRLSRDARLLFIQLWTIVDDSGKSRASSRMLASLLYPFDDDAPKLIDNWLLQLEREGHIRIYEAEGSHYLDIPNWLKHQKIDHPGKSKLPEFRESSRSLAKVSESLATDLGPRTLGKNGANAPLPEKDTAEKELFDRGKEVLGKNAGGLVRKVLKAKGENVALARAAIEQASTKQNPLEYAGRIAAGPPDNTPPDIREREKQAGFYARFDSPEQRAWEKHTGKSPRDRDGGWLYPAQWPEGKP